MNLLEKLKGIKKRWYLLTAVVLILLVGGCAAARIHYMNRYLSRPASQVSAQTFRQVELDLLYLEKVPNLRVTPDQAKEMLPLVERMSTPDAAAPVELAKQVYGLLTPLQYEVLAHQMNGNSRYPSIKGGERGERNMMHGQRMDNGGEHGFWKDGKGIQNPREEALGNVVIKMLTDRTTEKPAVEKPLMERTPPTQPPAPAAGGGNNTKSQ